MRFLILSILILLTGNPTQSYARSSYSFSNHPIDVVIPCVEKDLLTLNLCIAGIRENGANIARIIVVSKNKLTDQAEWFSEDAFPFTLADVALALSSRNSKNQMLLLEKNSRTGWYYQQLLKFYASQVIPGISPNILILDADTIFLNPVTFLNEQNAGMYNPGLEYHPPYFQHGAALIPGFRKIFPEYSGISHHMIFQKVVIDDLFLTVEQTHRKPFWQVYCELVDPQDCFYSGASEYEIYFNYLLSQTDQISIRKLQWKNVNKLSDIPRLKEEKFHYASIHSYDRIDE